MVLAAALGGGFPPLIAEEDSTGSTLLEIAHPFSGPACDVDNKRIPVSATTYDEVRHLCRVGPRLRLAECICISRRSSGEAYSTIARSRDCAGTRDHLVGARRAAPGAARQRCPGFEVSGMPRRQEEGQGRSSGRWNGLLHLSSGARE